MPEFFSNKIFKSRYQIALALIGVLSLATYFLISSLLSAHSKYAHIINISGKQRMLSQKISLYTQDYLETKNKHSLDIAKSSLSLFLKNHYYITNENKSDQKNKKLNQNIKEFYNINLTPLVFDYKSHIESLLESNKGKLDFEKVESLLTNLNEAVYLFEKASDDKVSSLMMIEIFIVFITLLILYLEAKLIFKPLNTILNKTIIDLKDKTEKALESNRVKNLFISSITHELRTPLSGIIGATDLMDKINLNSENKSYFEIIETCSNSMLRIVDEILDFSKYESSNIPVNISTFNLNTFIQSIKGKYNEKALIENLEWHVSYVEGEKWIATDEVRLYQIINNLLNNSFKYTQNGKVSLKIKIIDNRIQVIVEDNGDGISDINRALDPFYRQKEHEEKQINGIGVGLSIVNRLVSTLDGTMDIKSQKGIGTKVSILIPITLKTNVDIKQPSNGTKIFNHYLLVEDNLINQKIISKYIEKLGSTYEIANNGAEALKLLSESHGFDAILTDIKMPIMDGLALLENLKKDQNLSSLPVIAITANANRSDVDIYKSKGFDDVISKPIKPLELSKVLKKHGKA